MASSFGAEFPDRFPVSLLTGFLGSGKTTLLNGLLRHPEMAKTAVVINEFGEVALDQHFIERSDGEVTVLANGCLCCEVRDDFEGVVGTLFARRRRGETPAFERMIVETTGLADPAPLMQFFLNRPIVVDNFRLDAVVATIDAVHGAKQLREHSEAQKQAALADRLVLTKTDLVRAEALDSLAGLLFRLNPGAAVLRARHGDVDPSQLFGADAACGREAAGDPGKWLNWEAYAPAREHPLGTGEDHAHLAGVAAFSLALDQPVEWRAFSRWLTRLKVRHADQLLRVKGILHVQGERDPVAIHGVHHVFHPPVRLRHLRRSDATSRIVFITRGLSLAEVEANWREFEAGLLLTAPPGLAPAVTQGA